jgi:hypothetical protein
MSVYRCGLVLAAGLFFSTSLARAILIETKTGKVGGFLVSDDGTNLKIRIPAAGGEETVGEFLRADVKVLHQLDVKRLEKLSKDNPKGYRDYADELARQEGDPEARYTAERLYLIAATLAPEEFGSDSLIRMAPLARTPAQARKFRALAFLLDPKADPKILEEQPVKPAAPAALPARALDDFGKAMQLYRSGQIQLAADTAKREGVDKVFGMAPGKIDVKKFLQWCTDANCTTCRPDGTVNAVCPNCNGLGFVFNAMKRAVCPACKGKKRAVCPDCGGTHVRDPLPDETLRDVLRCELWAIDQQGAGDNTVRKDAAETKGWSTILQSRQPGPVFPLSLETITSFDPRKCLYRNRKWVAE